MDPRHDKQHPFGAVERLDLEFKRATDQLPSSFFETAYAPGAGRPVFEDGDMFTVTVPLAATAARTTLEVTPQVIAQVTAQVAACCREQPQPAKAIMATLDWKHWKTFQTNYLLPLIEEGILERTIPDKPRSRLQKYRLTDKGRATLLKGNES